MRRCPRDVKGYFPFHPSLAATAKIPKALSSQVRKSIRDGGVFQVDKAAEGGEGAVDIPLIAISMKPVRTILVTSPPR